MKSRPPMPEPDTLTAGGPALAAALAQISDQLALDLTSTQSQALVHYLALLQRWNATYNLTAVRDPAQMLTQHLADCLAVVPALRRQLSGLPAAEQPRLLDVGSGGGLPGAVFAVLQPELAVTCVDTVGKKAAFVRQVAVELSLRNLTAEHARVEKMVVPPFHIVSSRAFASLPDFTAWTHHLLAPGGVWMAMKGKRPDDEIAALPATIEVFHVEPITVPGMDAERCIVWMRPRG
jgi:16S rRNA (guanine527-N7)-methyltransferase